MYVLNSYSEAINIIYTMKNKKLKNYNKYSKKKNLERKMKMLYIYVITRKKIES